VPYFASSARVAAVAGAFRITFKRTVALVAAKLASGASLGAVRSSLHAARDRSARSVSVAREVMGAFLV
jgi:hypothetical protein